MKRGKIVKYDGIRMPDNRIIRGLEKKEEGYKYLEILEGDEIKSEDMKNIITSEYYRRVRKILKSKLNGGNIMKAINARAVSIVRYGASIINWTKTELSSMDRKTRKLLTIYGALHPRANTDRLYIKRDDGGRGLISVEDCVAIESYRLNEYLEGSQERLLNAVQKEGILNEGKNREEVKEQRKSQYEEKVLHGQFMRNTESVRDKGTWLWLRKGTLKKETEGSITAAKDQAL